MTLLIVWMLLAILVIHVCSLLETTLFSVRTSALMERAASGSAGAGLLLSIKQDRVDDAIGAIMILNTVAATVGSTLAGAQAGKLFGEARVGLLSAVMTVLILIISEITPKVMAARYAGNFSGFVGHALTYLIRSVAPLLILTRALTRLLARYPRETFTRSELARVIARAPTEGAISLAESVLLGNLIQSHAVTLRDVMTPRSIIVTMDAAQTIADLIAAPAADAFSRIPLVQGVTSEIVGYVSYREVLKAAASGGDRARHLEGFLHPIPTLQETVPICDAVEKILEQREAIALVTDCRGQDVGLVTLEDLFEGILGMEITDEPESIARLRQAVATSRKRRAEELRRRRMHESHRAG